MLFLCQFLYTISASYSAGSVFGAEAIHVSGVQVFTRPSERKSCYVLT
jgi:hypothetical protein